MRPRRCSRTRKSRCGSSMRHSPNTRMIRCAMSLILLLPLLLPLQYNRVAPGKIHPPLQRTIRRHPPQRW